MQFTEPVISAPLNISGRKIHAMVARINILKKFIPYNIVDESVRLLAFLT